MAEMTLLQSTAATVVGRGYLSADHLSTATGLDPAIMISKAGGNFANPAAGASIMTEIEATGWYKFALGVGDTDTLGALIIRGTHAGMDNIEVVYQVVAANVAANVTQWLSQACAAVTVNGVPEVDVTHWLGTAAAVPSVAGVPEVDITYGAGTAIAAGAIPNVAAGSVGGLAVIGLNANGYDGGWVWFDTAGAAGFVRSSSATRWSCQSVRYAWLPVASLGSKNTPYCS